jgi:hypothetical protein
MHFYRLGQAIVLLFLCEAAGSAEVDGGKLTEIIKRVDKHGAGHREAVDAVRQLQQGNGASLIRILRGMDDAGPLATNWLRGAFETIAQRELKAGRKLPAEALETFVKDTTHGDRARRLAYEWLVRVDATAPDRLLPRMLDDPSLELRYDALARRLEEIQADEVNGLLQKMLAVRYRNVLTHARDLEQIKGIAEKLKKLGEEVDLARHFGFVMQWKLIGPFDNTAGKGFAATYPPEQKVNFAAIHDGKSGKLRWQDFTTADPYGLVDLNRALDKHMGAVGYAAAEFTSGRERPIELRMGCINACKMWLNGELLLEREVYHTGMEIDQYVGKGTLRRGRNVILVKVCQNEQTEDWAQNWQFQLRVCDSRGTAVLSEQTRRPGDKETRR